MADVSTFRDYKFEYDDTYVVTVGDVGRPDLIAYKIYGSTMYYSVICAANDIKSPMVTRRGIRPDTSSNEDSSTLGIDSRDVWANHYNIHLGALHELYNGRLLLIPTVASANAWLLKYVV